MHTDSIAVRLRRSRQAAHLTQRELAARAGVSRVTLARHETGARTPTIPTLQAYAQALGLPVGELMPDAPAREAAG